MQTTIRSLAFALLLTLPAWAEPDPPLPDAPTPPPAPAPVTEAAEAVPDAPTVEMPSEADPVTQQLDAAKEAFAAETEAWRVAITEWFAGREAAARSAGNKKAVDRVKAEHAGYESTGAEPDGLPSPVRQRYAKARAAMTEAYAAAVAEYTKAGLDDRADVAEAEALAFNRPPRNDDTEKRPPTLPDTPLLRARRGLELALHDTRWRIGDGVMSFQGDGAGQLNQSSGPITSFGWAAMDGEQVLVRWPTGDFDVFTFNRERSVFMKDYLGRASSRAENILRAERIR